ncbi:hypothetical protein KCP75_20300 [Salmonella enterica subsp. enterica]|nr:hypothetical protein KCP75_20300 [Salmonella enterica subsp. enterica]
MSGVVGNFALRPSPPPPLSPTRRRYISVRRMALQLSRVSFAALQCRYRPGRYPHVMALPLIA